MDDTHAIAKPLFQVDRLHETIFADQSPSRENLRKDICILSTILKGVHVVEAVPSSLSLHDNHELKIWNHFASLLAIGTSADCGTNRVVAVTGIFTVDQGIQTAVFTQNGRLLASKPLSPSSSELKTHLVEDKSATALWDLLAPRNYKDDVRFSDHLSDVVSAFNRLVTLFHQSTSELASHIAKAIPTVSLFMLHRTRYRQSMRLDNGRQLWTDHPLTLICEEYRTRIDKSSFISVGGSVRIIGPPPTFFKKLLDQLHQKTQAHAQISTFDSPQSDSSLSKHSIQYIISPANISTWISIVEEHMDALSGLLLNSKGKVPDYSKESRKTDYAQLHRVLVSLECLIDGGLFELIIDADMAQMLNKKYQTGSAATRQKKQFKLFGHVPKEAENLQSGEGEYFDANSVTQYLRTLVSISTASRDFVGRALHASKSSDKAMKAYRIDVTRHDLGITSEDVVNFAQSYLAALDSFQSPGEQQELYLRKFLSSVITLGPDISKSAQTASAHAEAVLMSVLWSVHEHKNITIPDVLEWLEDFKGIDYMNIGVSKRGCWCCDALKGILIQKSKSLEFNLPGTHATVFPWVPPQELPVEILQEFRSQLVGVLTKHAQSHAAMSSFQSSPTSSTQDLPWGELPIDVTWDDWCNSFPPE